ncbi:ABC transporter, ATP-binding protein [Leptospira inadai serovar Lyme str. 10]|uniref:ABC transporter, ATP-binding protein n=2 Tax=Leptospira inadai serovar Lyme TaxID=293084 RepID=V6HSI3_9LEPT|nr:ABC transporter ATP-binding protein [Leptospira inadai]EQA35569.1 ABC transporter, ATP-binding protein [Leptospira inadai serovar Lyme str. 10]PNV73970.1 ABC transporter ATP-binding protein [Leptospira inadai serovar Lyme]
MLSISKLNKSYTVAGEKFRVLADIEFEVKEGEFVAIVGPSGSGKSTLLAIAAGLDKADSGNVILDGVSLMDKQEDELAKIRGEKIGFVFQNFQLIKTLNALENVSLPLALTTNLLEKEIRERAKFWLSKVGMEQRAYNFPSQLSGGEEQRVAIARSFIHEPKLLFADEPTANLDRKNGDRIMSLLRELNKIRKSTLLVVTHDPQVAALADRILEMRDGSVIINPKRGSKKNLSRAKKKTTSGKKK